MGAGDAARREAHKAVELDPKNADATVSLGWVLEHDTLGRMFGFDHDRAGARVALDHARKINPKHVGAAVESFMTLLEHDAHGLRYERGSDLRGAIAAWRDAYTLDPSAEHGQSPRACAAVVRLMPSKPSDVSARAGCVRCPKRDPDCRDRCRPRWSERGDQRGGTPLASGTNRTNVLAASGAILLALRNYDAARAIFAEAGTLRAGTPQATLVQKVTRHDDPFVAGKRVEDVVIALQLSALDPDRITATYWDAATARELRAEFASGAITNNHEGLVNVTFLEDVLRSASATQVEGDGAVSRVALEMFGTRTIVYGAIDHDVPKLIGSAITPAGAGRHVLRLLARNDEASARRLLDWLLKDTSSMPFKRVWGANLPRDRAGMELAAAVLTGTSDPDRALPIVTKCGATTTDGQLVCDLAVVDIDEKLQRHIQLEEFTAAWVARAPKVAVALVIHGSALGLVGRFDEADKQLDDALAIDPDNVLAQREKVYVAAGRGQLADAVRRADALVKRADAQDLNNIAWLRLYEGSDLQIALGLARDAVRADAKAMSALNTLAAIEVELGDLGAAKEDGWKAMPADSEKPDDAGWYVVGRMLEQLGLRDDAIAAYRRVDSR